MGSRRRILAVLILVFGSLGSGSGGSSSSSLSDSSNDGETDTEDAFTITEKATEDTKSGASQTNGFIRKFFGPGGINDMDGLTKLASAQQDARLSRKGAI